MAAQALRIALVTETWQPEMNGVAMTIGRLVDGLRSLGHQVQVVRPRQKVDALAASPDLLVKGLPLPGYKGLQFGLPARQALRRAWQSSRPDVVHVVTEGPLGWSALQEARALKVPVTSSYHTHFDGYSKHYGAGVIGPIVTAVLQHFHRRTLATLAPTRVLVDSLSRSRVPGARVLGRGVDTQLFQPSRRSETLRSEWGLQPNDLAVIHVGRLAAEKNLPLAARAFTAIHAQDARARMIWVGDGPARAGLEKKYPDHIFFGARRGESLAEAYASGDLFLFPSLTETYGNVVPEAMASGLSVVAWHDAAAAELIQNGVQGLTAQVRDEAAFIAAACQAAADPALRQRMGVAARQRVEPLTWASIVDEFETVLQAAAQGKL